MRNSDIETMTRDQLIEEVLRRYRSLLRPFGRRHLKRAVEIHRTLDQLSARRRDQLIRSLMWEALSD